ncbi:putative ribonuclease H-like domain-containing protein [Tanacetum coccineum]
MTKTSNEQGFISAVYKGKTHEDLHTCLFACFLSQVEPKKVIQDLTDPSWIKAMQDELLQFKLQKGYTQEEGIYYDKVFAPVVRIEAIGLFLAYALFKDFVVYQMDVKSAFLYGKIEEEVYVCQPPGFEDPKFPDRVYKVEKALYGLHQAPRAWNENAKDVDVHLYRSMIGSLMYLTSSRPDIMFVVCACARFQVTPKVSHLYAVKRIFRYLKGQPKLGLWYPKDSPLLGSLFFEVQYASATVLDRESTIGAANDGIQVSTVSLTYYWDSYTFVSIYAGIISNEGGQPSEPQHAPTTASPSHSSGPATLVADETVHEERGDNVERAATIAASLDAEQDSGSIIRTQSMATLNEPIPQGTSSGSGPKRQDTILGDRPAQTRVLALENIKTAQNLEIINLKKRVKKLENKKRARTPQLKRRLFKVRIESSAENSLGDQEDASKQGRNGIDQDEKFHSINITTPEPVTTVSAPVTTAGVSISTTKPSTPPTTTILIEDEDLTIAQTLMKMRSVKSKEKSKEKVVSSETTIRPTKGVIMKEASETVTIPIVPPQQQLDPKDKGKGIMQEPEKPIVKGKDKLHLMRKFAQKIEAGCNLNMNERRKWVQEQREEEDNLIS